MARALRGKDQILLFRLLKDAASAKAAKLAFQTEHETSKSSDSESTETKDGAISSSKGKEEEVTFSCILAQGDPTYEMLDGAMDNGDTVEIWEVDVTEPDEQGKYPGKYRQGVMTELTVTANAEDLLEMEGTYMTNGTARKGQVTLTKEQQEVVQYEFRDTTEYTEEAGETI